MGQYNTHKDIQNFNNKENMSSILHFGLGAFFKAHFCVYIQALNDLNKEKYFINAISLRSDTTKKEMLKQNNIYTVHERDHNESSFKTISCIQNSLFLQEDREYINILLASKHTKIITLTITEKGYCYSPSSKGLDVNNEDIVFDLKNSKNPKSAIGIICYGLQKRKSLGLLGLSIVSCDNLPSNGVVLKSVILDFASLIDTNLALWIEKECTFPSTMVDRIVPKMTPKSNSYIQKVLGKQDNMGIICESFSQFVIEDNFVKDQRPAFDKVGALFVKDVSSYENMKLRVVNGTHSALAYMGVLLNKQTIFEAISDKNLEIFIQNMMEKEILPSLFDMKNIDLKLYAKKILNRYKNKNIEHKTIQIAMDGSLKLPQRWLSCLKFLIEQKMNYNSFALCLASWIKFSSSFNLQGEKVDVNDPLKLKYIEIWEKHESSLQIIKEYFSLDEIFDKSFKSNIVLTSKVAHYLENINNLEQLIKEINNENVV